MVDCAVSDILLLFLNYSTITAIASHATRYVPSFSSISIPRNYSPVATSTRPDDRQNSDVTDEDAMLDMVVKLFGGKRKCGRWGTKRRNEQTGGLQEHTRAGSPIQLDTVKQETEQEVELAGGDDAGANGGEVDRIGEWSGRGRGVGGGGTKRGGLRWSEDGAEDDANAGELI